MHMITKHARHTLSFTPIFLQSVVPTWVQSSLTTSEVLKASLTLATTFTYTPFLAAKIVQHTKWVATKHLNKNQVMIYKLIFLQKKKEKKKKITNVVVIEKATSYSNISCSTHQHKITYRVSTKQVNLTLYSSSLLFPRMSDPQQHFVQASDKWVPMASIALKEWLAFVLDHSSDHDIEGEC